MGNIIYSFLSAWKTATAAAAADGDDDDDCDRAGRDSWRLEILFWSSSTRYHWKSFTEVTHICIAITIIIITIIIIKLLGLLRRVDLIIKWVSDVRPYTKSFSDSDEIWYVGKGR